MFLEAKAPLEPALSVSLSVSCSESVRQILIIIYPSPAPYPFLIDSARPPPPSLPTANVIAAFWNNNHHPLTIKCVFLFSFILFSYKRWSSLFVLSCKRESIAQESKNVQYLKKKIVIEQQKSFKVSNGLKIKYVSRTN